MAKSVPVSIIVTAMPGVVGQVFTAAEFFPAIEAAARAKAAGFEAKIFTVFNDGTLREFDPAAKTWGAELPELPVGKGATLPDEKAAALEAGDGK